MAGLEDKATDLNRKMWKSKLIIDILKQFIAVIGERYKIHNPVKPQIIF